MGKYLPQKWIFLQQLMKGMGQSSYPLSRKSVGSLLTLPIVKKGGAPNQFREVGRGKGIALARKEGGCLYPTIGGS